MGIAERRAREKDELRQKILDAAVELFLQDGYESVSMRKLAGKIEYAPSTIYLYFKNKSEIINAICADAFERLIEGLDEIDSRGLPALAQCEAGMRWYIEFGLTNPHQYQFVFNGPEPEGVEDDPATNQLAIRALGILARCIARCREEGIFAPGDHSKDSIAIWAQLHGVTSVIITDHGKHAMPWPTREELIDRSIELILNSLLA